MKLKVGGKADSAGLLGVPTRTSLGLAGAGTCGGVDVLGGGCGTVNVSEAVVAGVEVFGLDEGLFFFDAFDFDASRFTLDRCTNVKPRLTLDHSLPCRGGRAYSSG